MNLLEVVYDAFKPFLSGDKKPLTVVEVSNLWMFLAICNGTLRNEELAYNTAEDKELKKILKRKEERVFDCTLLVSSGRTPTEMQFPEEWKITKLYAKGSMHRSPGIGLLVTSFKQKDFICIEYLREAFDKETISRFKELLLEELTQE